MTEKSDSLNNSKNTINNTTIDISTMFAKQNTYTYQNAISSSAILSNAFKETDLASAQIAMKSISNRMSNLIKASNNDTFQNAIFSSAVLSNAFKETDLASAQIAMKSISNRMSNLIKASNNDTFQNAIFSSAVLSNAFKETDLASAQIAMKSISNRMSNLIKASNNDTFQNAISSSAILSNAFKETDLASAQIAMKSISNRMSNLIKASNNDTFQNATSSSATLSNTFNAIRALHEYSEVISEIDWQDLNPTEIKVKQAYETSEDAYVEENTSKELNNNKSRKEIIARLRYVLVTIFLIIGYLSDLIAVIEYTEYTIYPAIQSLSDHTFNSDKTAIKWLNNELKQDVSVQITNNFRIVTKDDLDVREGKKVASRIKGKLNSKDVVQIIEKKRNWTYISYSNHKESEYVEGWVFTRYLKQIK